MLRKVQCLVINILTDCAKFSRVHMKQIKYICHLKLISNINIQQCANFDVYVFHNRDKKWVGHMFLSAFKNLEKIHLYFWEITECLLKHMPLSSAELTSAQQILVIYIKLLQGGGMSYVKTPTLFCVSLISLSCFVGFSQVFHLFPYLSI